MPKKFVKHCKLFYRLYIPSEISTKLFVYFFIKTYSENIYIQPILLYAYELAVGLILIGLNNFNKTMNNISFYEIYIKMFYKTIVIVYLEAIF